MKKSRGVSFSMPTDIDLATYNTKELPEIHCKSDSSSTKMTKSGISKNQKKDNSNSNEAGFIQRLKKKFSNSTGSPNATLTSIECSTEEFPREGYELDLSSDSSFEDNECLTECHVNSQFEFDNIRHPIIEVVNKMGSGGKGKKENLKDITDLHYIGSGKCLVTDMISGRISIFSQEGKIRFIPLKDDLMEPWSTAVIDDNIILVTSRKERNVSAITLNGEFVFSFGSDIFLCPCGIAVDGNGRIIVTDILTNDVSVFEKNGKWLQNLGDHVSPVEQFTCPRYVHVSVTKDIIISDSGNHCVKVFEENYRYKFAFGTFGRQDGEFKTPYGITTDAKGNILVSDHYNHRVCIYSRTGVFLYNIVTGSDGLLRPQGIALSNDRLFVSQGKIKATEIVIFSFKNKY